MQTAKSNIQNCWTTILVLLGVLAWVLACAPMAAAGPTDPAHLDPTYGVDRTPAYVVGDCAQCHETFDPNICGANDFNLFSPYNPTNDDGFCFQCHNDPANSYHGINIYAQFTASTDTYGGVNESNDDYYRTVNTKHDVLDSDQAHSATKMECGNCHNVHRASRNYMLIDPDDRNALFTETMTHPGTDETVFNSITFCLKCHDNTWAADGSVTGPVNIIDIATTYFHLTGGGDEHGASEGSRNINLNGPYDGEEVPVPAMPCTDCHDPHGGEGIYHLKTLTDQYNVEITITAQNIGDHIVAHWCSHCHNDPMNQLDGDKDRCVNDSCHNHGSGSF